MTFRNPNAPHAFFTMASVALAASATVSFLCSARIFDYVVNYWIKIILARGQSSTSTHITATSPLSIRLFVLTAIRYDWLTEVTHRQNSKLQQSNIRPSTKTPPKSNFGSHYFGRRFLFQAFIHGGRSKRSIFRHFSCAVKLRWSNSERLNWIISPSQLCRFVGLGLAADRSVSNSNWLPIHIAVNGMAHGIYHVAYRHRIENTLYR